MQISYIGMQTAEVAIAPVIKVILKTDAKALDEVVVTAWVSQKRKSVRYAVQDVKGDKLTQASSSNLSSALQGKVSGWKYLRHQVCQVLLLK